MSIASLVMTSSPKKEKEENKGGGPRWAGWSFSGAGHTVGTSLQTVRTRGVPMCTQTAMCAYAFAEIE